MYQAYQTYYGGSQITFFNLQTSGLILDEQIIQISAFIPNKDNFSAYILPTIPINKRAAAVNGPEFNTMVSHNGKTFHAAKLMKEILHLNMKADFRQVISGFADTLEILSESFSQRRRRDGQLTLKALDRYFLGGIYTRNLHNNMTNAHLLHHLTIYLGIHDNFLRKMSTSFNYQVKSHFIMLEKRRIKRSLQILNNCIFRYMIIKLAENRISLRMLINGYKNYGETGLINYLSNPVGRRICIIARKPEILNAIVSKISQLCQ